MRFSELLRLTVIVVAAIAITMGPSGAQPKEPAPKPRVDRGKGRIERPLERAIAAAQPGPKKGELAPTPKKAIELPVKNVIAGAQPKPIPAAPARAVDQGKRDIELPVKNAIAGNQSTVRSAAFSGKFRNPKVEPGKVRWHEDFEAACAASKKSGKPVLLFQMIGKLDDRFC